MTADETEILRAALNGESGLYLAGTDPESVARHRRESAADAEYHAEYLQQYGPDGYRRNQYRQAVEQNRQEAVEAAGCAAEPLKKPCCVWDDEAKTLRVVFS